MNVLVVVFAKDPVPGRVKTRLGTSIGNALAAELYSGIVADLLEELMQKGGPWDIEIHADRQSIFFEPFECPVILQQGANLGEKLYHSLARGLAKGAGVVAIIGSDAPALRADWLKELIGLTADVAIGPTDDGGFWGIAARRSHPAMFDGVRWSTANALEDTVDAVRRAGLAISIGPQGWDLDEAADLARLQSEGCAGPRTAAILARNTARPEPGTIR